LERDLAQPRGNMRERITRVRVWVARYVCPDFTQRRFIESVTRDMRLLYSGTEMNMKGGELR